MGIARSAGVGALRRGRGLRLLLLGALLGPVIGIVATLLFSNSLSSRLADGMAANMVPPGSAEVSSTAFSPPASAMEVAAISGRGEGLDCSIEPVVLARAFPHATGTPSVNLQYRQACVAHDYCYRHGAATYGYSQADCDGMLARASLRICHFAGHEGDDDCLTRARKVYSGLVFGGAESFRPGTPDERSPSGARPAYERWRNAVETRFTAGSQATSEERQRLRAERDMILGAHPAYDSVDARDLPRMLDAWLDVTSIASEYDPYPMGTAAYALPRLVRLAGGRRSLVFFKHRAGGTALAIYDLRPSHPGRLLVACESSTCGRPATDVDLPGQYGSLVSAPWVGWTAPGVEKLVWWRRGSSAIDTTGGNVVSATFGSPRSQIDTPVRKSPWTFGMAPASDFGSAQIYPIGGRRDVAVASVTDQWSSYQTSGRAAPGARRVDLVVSLWKGAQPASRGWRAMEGAARIRLYATEGGRRSPEQDLRHLIASPLFATDAPGGGIEVALFNRAVRPDAYRTSVSAWRFRLPEPASPVDTKGRLKFKPPYAYTSASEQRFEVPEQTEPSVPLVGRDGNLRLLTISCRSGSPAALIAKAMVWLGWIERPRCAAAASTTLVTIHSAVPASPGGAELPGRYLARAVLLDNPARDPSAPAHLLVLVRYGIVKTGRRAALTAVVRIVGIGDGRIYPGREVDLGVISPAHETTVRQALLRTGRLFPLVGDADGDGTPDLVIADTQNGYESVALTTLVPREGLVARPR